MVDSRMKVEKKRMISRKKMVMMGVLMMVCL